MGLGRPQRLRSKGGRLALSPVDPPVLSIVSFNSGFQAFMPKGAWPCQSQSKSIGDGWQSLRLTSRAILADPSKSPPLPDQPSIAVLPFHNPSGDPEQEYFADGIAEDVLTTLSKIRDLLRPV